MGPIHATLLEAPWQQRGWAGLEVEGSTSSLNFEKGLSYEGPLAIPIGGRTLLVVIFFSTLRSYWFGFVALSLGLSTFFGFLPLP